MKIKTLHKFLSEEGNVFQPVKIEDLSIKELMERLGIEGNDINSLDKYGNTVLHLAIKKKVPINIIYNLINKGVDINKGNAKPLISAIIYSGLPLARYLISKGAKVNTKDVSGNPLLAWAVYENKMSFLKLLLSKGAKVNLLKGRERQTVLDIVLDLNRRYPKNNKEAIDLIRSKGAKTYIELKGEKSSSKQNSQEFPI